MSERLVINPVLPLQPKHAAREFVLRDRVGDGLVHVGDFGGVELGSGPRRNQGRGEEDTEANEKSKCRRRFRSRRDQAATCHRTALSPMRRKKSAAKFCSRQLSLDRRARSTLFFSSCHLDLPPKAA